MPQEDVPPSPGRPPTVLVVEDDTVLAMEVERMAGELGYVSLVCVSGEDAIAAARRLHPDLVLMDVKLRGDIDGIEAAEAIKDELGCEIVFMTAYGDPALARNMRRIAGIDVLGKPISAPILRMMLKDKLGAASSRGASLST